MKVVHLSTSSRGGAGIAALRLHEMLLQHNIDSHFLSKNKPAQSIENCYTLNDAYKGLSRFKTILKNILEKTSLFQFGNSAKSKKLLVNKPVGFEYFSFPDSNLYIEECEIVNSADIIHLHWVAEDFINYSSFFQSLKAKKFIWTLHDMNPFTGGCHHSDECIKFTGECKNCPQLPSYSSAITAFNIQKQKADIYSGFNNLNFCIVTPSEWLGKLSRKSACFHHLPHYKIINPVNSNIFSIMNKKEARKELGLPIDKKILLFVSHNTDNKRKGISALLEAVKMADKNDFILCTAGQSNITSENIHHLGYLENDQKMALAYNAADCFILPSIAENFPNTIVESLLCGTPVIASDTGGIPEQISTDGILIRPVNAKDLTLAIKEILSNPTYSDRMAIRNSALSKFDPETAILEYISLYNQLCKS
jgi:glycosyltransferase involved in cell wall biosynthesis